MPFSIKTTATENKTACELLAEESDLSKGKIKDAMAKGAVWLTRRGKKKRLRRATAEIKSGEVLEIHYDENLLRKIPPVPALFVDHINYSIWLKPAGLLSQGTRFGDHCSLVRIAEKHFHPPREVFPVHRLDRETKGLVILAHTKKAAKAFSEMFRNNLIEKTYKVQVAGVLDPETTPGRINLPLDGKNAVTDFEVLEVDSSAGITTLDVTLQTGRFHQIRRHFDLIGHPVMGDPKYGKGNKNREGLCLSATGLRFKCPFTGEKQEYSTKGV